MSDTTAGSDRMSEVVRMARTLADRLLDAQIMQGEMPADQVRALVDAAVLMEERGVPWPPMMMQVLQAVEAGLRRGDAAEDDPEPARGEVDPYVGGAGTIGGALRRLVPRLGRRRD
ncbi:hypothetical protein [Methylobacterium fujisawaense]|jgi:hypothetical protein